MNKPKRKGTEFETQVVNYLRDNGFPNAERRALTGALDRGDVAGVPGWTLELKAHRELDLGGFMREAKVEALNAGTRQYAVIAKRRQHGTADAYAVVPLWLFAELMGDRL